MAKTGKQKNDLRGVRKETAILFVVGAVVALFLYAAAVVQGNADPLYSGGFVLAVYLASCAAAYFLLERRKHGGARDETLAPVMGRIMFDAVVKMSTPVFICDSSERIIWYNPATEELYSDRNKLYGETVSELFGVSLDEIRSDKSEKGCRLACRNNADECRSFLAKYNHIKTDDNDFALVTTVEVTELDALTEKMNGDETVVMYIIIDNLSEMMQYDSEQYRPAAARIDEVLRSWADNYGGILKEYERDKYLFVTDARTLDALIADKFDVLDRVREVRVGDTSLPLTISIGVSGVRGSFENRERTAHDALDLALQRGGDQAVVKRDGSTDFFGGVTRSVQKRTNVRSRVVSNELMSAMKKASAVLIMGHTRADFDAFGSCVGLARIAMLCGAEVHVILDMADRNLVGCRELLDGEEEFRTLFITREEALDRLETGTLVILADVNNVAIAEAPEVIRRASAFAVIDHHRKTAEFEREPDVEYIEPSSSSASELVAEMLEQVLPRDELSAAEATVLLAGITLDTSQFTRRTGTRTFSAAMYLRDRGADPTTVQELFRESIDEYRREARFRQNVEIYRGCCAIAVSGEGDAGDAVAVSKAANNLLKVEGVRAAFAVMQMGDCVKISARSDGSVNVQLIMEELHGGGHYDAAATVQKERTAEEVLRDLKLAIDRRLD